jgi:hypothetical protein
VALLDMPCFNARELSDGSTPVEDSAGRINEWNGLLAQAALRHPGTVRVFNLDPLLCPNGKFTWKDSAGRDMRRDDGVHFTEAGGQDVGNYVLPKIVAWVRPRDLGRATSRRRLTSSSDGRPGRSRRHWPITPLT